MIGASCLVLTSCLPEDDVLLNDRELNNIESQIQLYARSFQQYQNRSLSNFVNGIPWLTQSATEGVLVNANMGNAGDFLSSAYCRGSSDEHYHITWFTGRDGDGHVSLKGLGTDLIGQANQKIKSLIPDTQFGIYNGEEIVMSNQAVLSLSAGCSLDIPSNSAVAAVSIPMPNDILAMDTKTILRTRACNVADEQGGVVESVDVGYLTDTAGQETYIYNGTEYRDQGGVSAEERVTAAISGSDWSLVSNDCVAMTDATLLTGANQPLSMIDTAVLANINTDIAEGLSGSLSGINCIMVGDENTDRDVNDLDGDGNTSEFLFQVDYTNITGNDRDDLDGDGDTSEAISAVLREMRDVDTCESDPTLQLTDNSNLYEIETFQTVLPGTLSCPADGVNFIGNGSLTVDFAGEGGASFFNGIDSALAGTAGNISTTQPIAGELDIERIIQTFVTLVELAPGDGLPNYTQAAENDARAYLDNIYADSNHMLPNEMETFEGILCEGQDGCDVYNNTRVVGIGGQCNAQQTITFSCQAMYPGLTPLNPTPVSSTLVNPHYLLQF